MVSNLRAFWLLGAGVRITCLCYHTQQLKPVFVLTRAGNCEVEAGQGTSRSSRSLRLHCEFEASLGYKRPCLKTQKPKPNKQKKERRRLSKSDVFLIVELPPTVPSGQERSLLFFFLLPCCGLGRNHFERKLSLSECFCQAGW